MHAFYLAFLLVTLHFHPPSLKVTRNDNDGFCETTGFL